MRTIKSIAVLFGLALTGAAQDFDGTVFTGRLLVPISTRISKTGDPFTLQVIDPSAYASAIIRAHIAQLKRPGRAKGNAEILLTFDFLQLGGMTVPIKGELVDVRNSKGVAHVDEEGNVIGQRATGKDVAKILLLMGAGAAAGAGLSEKGSRGSGAAKGAAAGAAVGTSIVLATRGPEIEFASGGLLLLRLYHNRR